MRATAERRWAPAPTQARGMETERPWDSPTAVQVPPVTLRDVRVASRRLQAVLPPSPLVYSGTREAWLKLESLQPTGAYKVRGALNALMVQVERGDKRPVMAASAGNHGAGVAWAARHLGLEAQIVVPEDAPRAKTARITALGAKVVRFGSTFEESLSWAEHHAQNQEHRLLHAFDDPDIIAGQGTVALELLDAEPDVVAVPVGGGGLAAGTSIVLRAAGIRVVGVQVVGVDALGSHLRGGPDRIDPRATVADGLRVREAGRLTRTLCRDGLDGVVMVTEDEVRDTMVSLAAEEHLVVEGAGAVSVAGLSRLSGHRRVAVVSGGNVDLEVLADLVRERRPSLRS